MMSPTPCHSAIPPFCHSAILPFCHSATFCHHPPHPLMPPLPLPHTQVDAHLANCNITVRNYSAIASDASLLASKEGPTESRVWLDPSSCSYSIYSEVGAGSRGEEAILLAASPVTLAKALKVRAEKMGIGEGLQSVGGKI